MALRIYNQLPSQFTSAKVIRFYVETNDAEIKEVVECWPSPNGPDIYERFLNKTNLDRWAIANKEKSAAYYLDDLKSSSLNYVFGIKDSDEVIEVRKVRCVWYEEEEKS